VTTAAVAAADTEDARRDHPQNGLRSGPAAPDYFRKSVESHDKFRDAGIIRRRSSSARDCQRWTANGVERAVSSGGGSATYRENSCAPELTWWISLVEQSLNNAGCSAATRI